MHRPIRLIAATIFTSTIFKSRIPKPQNNDTTFGDSLILLRWTPQRLSEDFEKTKNKYITFGLNLTIQNSGKTRKNPRSQTSRFG